MVYFLPAFVLILKNINVNGDRNGITRCIWDSYHSDVQLDSTENGMQVRKECWTFGMHLNNYLEYYLDSGMPIYLRKYHKNITRKDELTAIYKDEQEFNGRKAIEMFLIAFVQVRCILS